MGLSIPHEEFAELYAKQAGVPLQTLVHKQRMACKPCGCGANYCLGWVAYFQGTGRESHGDPRRMMEVINRKQS